MTRPDEAERHRLNHTFRALCAIPSPSGRERACADFVRDQLRGMGLDVEEDGAGAATGGQCGNLLARVPGAGAAGLLLCTHLDTVVPQAPIEPEVVDGGWVNAHQGILGADNKAAVAVVLEVARRFAQSPPPLGLELLFTVSEETGLHGAKAFDAAQLGSAFGYVFDHATAIGEIVQASPTHYGIDAEFRGAAAHAGIRPQDGRNAIAAAAQAVAAMRLGRIDPRTTANVGAITGGSSSTNVVAERCRVEAEARSLDDAAVEALVAEMVDHLHDGANAAECDVDVMVEKKSQGYRVRPSTPAIRAAESALAACGYEPRLIETGGLSDANALEDQGVTCVNLANGTERNHEPDERVSVAALEGMLDVALELVEAAARC